MKLCGPEAKQITDRFEQTSTGLLAQRRTSGIKGVLLGPNKYPEPRSSQTPHNLEKIQGADL